MPVYFVVVVDLVVNEDGLKLDAVVEFGGFKGFPIVVNPGTAFY
jgi:hypothetical protein